MTGDGALLLAGRGLHKSFGWTPVRGVDISVDEGVVLAVMGPSGSGKSTLLHCLAGILTPDAGEVVFDGRRVDRMFDNQRSRLRRGEFGFVFQFGQLVPELPVRENIAFPLLLGGMRRRAALAEARKWLPRLGLEAHGGPADRGRPLRHLPHGRRRGHRHLSGHVAGLRRRGPRATQRGRQPDELRRRPVASRSRRRRGARAGRSGGRAGSADARVFQPSALVEPGPDADRLPVQTLLIPTDGTPAAQERIRTLAAVTVPLSRSKTSDDLAVGPMLDVTALATVLPYAMVFVLIFTACSLTVSVIAGVLERRRPFAVLRASGVRLGELRRIVLLE